ncbi:hypothetical protein ACFVYF_33405 [Streptomyces sp. NPDC058274]|jgi:hypothetical protein|uniref:hypothetical protein n=1 Tax=Streptomyces sp. NPDC058274 TaxID=3346416 RepID=UPI0029D17930|nr:hypothetical protein [Streptomyces sp.]
MHIRDFVRRRHAPAHPSTHSDLAARVCSELAADLPDEDVGEDLDDCLALYELGSKPRCEEVEYLGMVQEAIERIERGE